MKSKQFLRFLWSKLVPLPNVKFCSQTIYEALLGCIRMYETTEDQKWKERAGKVLKILIKIQRPDGGFDIGYDFNFGRLHKKGDSTSPELVALLAFSEYARAFDAEELVKPYADKAAEWIRQFAIKIENEIWAIPYSPHTINEVMVYNGTSFACGALGYYLGVFKVEDDELKNIYKGMVNYLEGSLFSNRDLSGRFWYYPVQTRTDLEPEMLDKIDYYHQMQQVEMHAFAERFVPVAKQHLIIEDCSDHIVSLNDKLGIVPYTNSSKFFSGMIHVWGLCSVASGLIEAGKVVPDKYDLYTKNAKIVYRWIVDHSWNGEYFFPVLTKDGTPFCPKEYMVRSDAWVFSSLANCHKELDGTEELSNIIEKCYQKMEKSNFSGKESHASNFRIRLMFSFFKAVKRFIRK